MAKVVSTKFGDRHLVHLPPVSLSGKETPAVQTLDPRNRDSYYDRTRHSGYNDRSRPAKVIPKEYAYRDQRDEKRNHGNRWIGPPEHSYHEGNIVATRDQDQQYGFGDRIWHGLLQDANVSTLQNYSQGQYPAVLPAGGQDGYMQYTQQGLSAMPQGEQQVQPIQAQPPAPYQPPVQPQQQPPASDPNEKHIYYGPNGEILPGPPPGFGNQGSQGSQPRQNDRYTGDFAIEGILYGGKLTAIQLLDNSGRFPKIPEYLTRNLFQKYHQFEKTMVRIIARRGEINVHAVPDIAQPPPRPDQPTQYVPVYVDENDEIIRPEDMYGINGVNQRVYGTPLDFKPSLPYNDRGYSRRIRPETTDPISELRWTKDNDDRTVSVRPVERPDTNPISKKTRMVYT